MKRFTLLVVMLLAITGLMAQIDRTMVVMEIGTGTWCQYCPGAAMGADDLLEHGCFVAVVENHNGDTYANTYSNARNSYYGITGYPTAVFDGILKYVGGNHSSSLYTTYLPRYNQRISIPSPVQMSMEITNTGLSYQAVITITKVGTITATNLVAHFVVTQSHINQNWQGQTHLEHVNRLMVPDQNGTAISFTSGDVQVVTLNFDMNSAWPVEDCEFIAFVQDKTGHEIQNGIKRGAIDLNVDYAADNTSIQKNEVVTFTNNTFGGYIGVPETYEWIFPGGSPASDTVKDPVVTYSEVGTYDVTLIVNRGGQIDTVTKSDYITVSPGVGISDKGKELSVNVYPNPSNGTFAVEMNTTGNKVVDMKVINTANVLVYEENNITINGQLVKNLKLNNLSSGMYYLILQNGKNKTVQKIFVK
jgi:hypothetical protein